MVKSEYPAVAYLTQYDMNTETPHTIDMKDLEKLIQDVGLPQDIRVEPNSNRIQLEFVTEFDRDEISAHFPELVPAMTEAGEAS